MQLLLTEVKGESGYVRLYGLLYQESYIEKKSPGEIRNLPIIPIQKDLITSNKFAGTAWEIAKGHQPQFKDTPVEIAIKFIRPL